MFPEDFPYYKSYNSIELIDSLVVGPILEAMKSCQQYKVLILPDHPTPLPLRTHTSEPVPFVIYSGNSPEKLSGVNGYDEIQAGSTGLFIEEGYTLMDFFIKNRES
jgi:2,3-bisphosphoglycerate-independent phosphoglycerate mutase